MVSQDRRELLTCLGAAIQRRRAGMKLSQQQVADGAGLHRTYMCDIEKGARNITLASLENIAGAMHTTSAALLLDAYDQMKNINTKKAQA